VEKTKETYVLPLLNDCYCATINFDLQMSKCPNFDVFALVINFMGFDWKPKQVILVCLKLLRLQNKCSLENSLIFWMHMDYGNALYQKNYLILKISSYIFKVAITKFS
jgi:hypothetical protein